MMTNVAERQVIENSIAWKHYPCVVEFDRYFLSGLKEGMTITEEMGFITWEDACAWAGECTMSTKCDFVVLEMRNLKTGETENF